MLTIDSKKPRGFGLLCCTHKGQRRRQMYNNARALLLGRISSIFVTVLALFQSITVTKAISEIDSTYNLDLLQCEDLNDSVTSIIEEGWPFKVGCEKLMDNFYYYTLDEYSSNSTEQQRCLVVSNGIVVHDVNITIREYDPYSYESENEFEPYAVQSVSANDNGSVFTSYLIGENGCTKMTYNLVTREGNNLKQTCVENSANSETSQLNEGISSSLFCKAERKNFHLTSGSYNVTWYKGCKVINTSIINEEEKDTNEIIVSRLEISRANFEETPGEYSCSVTYKGVTKFLSRTNVCVKYREYRGHPQFRSETQRIIKAKEGDDVTLTCGGTTGTQSGLSLIISWDKNETNGTQPPICSFVSALALQGDSVSTQKYYCSISSDINVSGKCYRDAVKAKKNDGIGGITTASSSLVIRDFTSSDANTYNCRIATTSGVDIVEFQVEFESEDQGDFFSILVILLPTFGIILVLLIALFIYFYTRRNDLKHDWKHCFKTSKEMKDLATQETRNSPDVASVCFSDNNSKSKKEIPKEIV